MKNNISNNKQILDGLVVVLTLVLVSACSPVKFSQGDSSVDKSSTGTDGKNGEDGKKGKDGAIIIPPTNTTSPIITRDGSFTTINVPIEQTENLSTVNSVDVAVNISELTYHADTDSCSFKYQYFDRDNCHIEIDPSCPIVGSKLVPGTPEVWTKFKNGIAITPKTSFSCSQIKQAQEIRALGACKVTHVASLKKTELQPFYDNPSIVTSVESAVISNALLLIWSNNSLETNPAAITPIALALDVNCNCYYPISAKPTLGGHGTAKIPALPSHCAAHFDAWK